MKLIKIIKSSNNKKKYDAYFLLDNGKQKKTSFGAAGSSDFLIQQNNPFYRLLFLKTKDPTRAGFLSYYITWNKKNINDSIEDYKKRFNL